MHPSVEQARVNLAQAARQRTLALAGWLRRTWWAHGRLLRDNVAYAAAVSAGAVAAAAQDDLLDLIATVVGTLLAIYATTRSRVCNC